MCRVCRRLLPAQQLLTEAGVRPPGISGSAGVSEQQLWSGRWCWAGCLLQQGCGSFAVVHEVAV